MSNWMQSGLHQELVDCSYGFAAERSESRPEAAAPPSGLGRGRIVRLKEAVLRMHGRSKKPRSSMNGSIIDTLNSHFQYLNERVACSQARAFLPELLEASLEVRIPTPITAHVDHCPQCANDLEGLRELGLDARRLRRLGWLYGHEPTRGLLLCRRARSRIAAFARGALEGIDGEILSHLSTCPRCRADVYARREALLKELGDTPDGCCEHVPPVHLFDYAIPCAHADHGVERPDASHVGTCRKCLETIQSVHRTIYGIADRPDSGVVTVYHAEEDNRVLTAEPGNPYAAHGVSVEIVQRESDGFAARGRTAVRNATVNPHVRRILKAAIAAAAIIPLAALFHYTHSASGITLGKVFRAFGQAQNVRVVAFHPATERAIYELWIARGLNMQGMMTDAECFVYDLSRGEKENVDSGEVVRIGGVELANARRLQEGCLGFKLADVPADARWDRTSVGGGREVYELTWMKQSYAGYMSEVKYEVTVDKSTLLPESLRLFRRESAEAGWECKSVMVLQYLTETQMRSVVRGQSIVGADRRQ